MQNGFVLKGRKALNLKLLRALHLLNPALPPTTASILFSRNEKCRRYRSVLFRSAAVLFRAVGRHRNERVGVFETSGGQRRQSVPGRRRRAAVFSPQLLAQRPDDAVELVAPLGRRRHRRRLRRVAATAGVQRHRLHVHVLHRLRTAAAVGRVAVASSRPRRGTAESLAGVRRHLSPRRQLR